jgi:ribonuclease VapC
VIAIDASAIVAVLKEEAEAESFAEIIVEAERCFLSAVGFFETSMVMIGRGEPALADGLDALVERRGIEIVSFDWELARESRAAFIRFGKGRHPAGLNFGDCVSYALAQARRLPLLYKGEDFAKTDVVSAVRRSVSG